jgi:hypothetical protein
MRSERLAVRLNTAAGLNGERRPVLFGSLILEGPRRWLLMPVSEVFLEHDVSGSTELSALAGAIFTVRKDLSLDLGLRISRVSQGQVSWDSTEIRAGVSWRL